MKSGATITRRQNGERVEAMRTTEPKEAYTIVSEVIADIMKKSKKTRGNIGYYAPEVQRETAIAKPNTKPAIDFLEGDFVQIRPNGKRNIGRIGMIISVRYLKFDKTGDGLVYTVKFSDQESGDYVSNNLQFVRRNTAE